MPSRGKGPNDLEVKEAVRELRERLAKCGWKLAQDTKKIVRECRCEISVIDRAIHRLERLRRKKAA
jgi:hypothetical protein